MDYLETKETLIKRYDNSTKINDKRFYALCLTSLVTGGRISDMIKIRWNNFDFSRDVVAFTNTKSKKRQKQRVCSELKRILLDYQNVSFRYYGKVDEVFYNYSTKTKLVNRLSITRRCKHEFDFTFHEFRRLSAKNIANQKGIVGAKNFLGHARVSTTDLYLNLSEDQYLEDMKDVSI
jgi:integrase